MKRIYLLVLLLVACVNEPEPPGGTLRKDQMVGILIDIHIAEAKANQAGLRSSDSTQVFYRALEQDIFHKHRVDTATYNRSYRWYLQHTKLMDQIYAAVVDSLSLKENLLKME